MEKFCKKFDFVEQLEEDDLYLSPDIVSLIKSAKRYGSIVVFNGCCTHFPDRPLDCSYAINTGKISVANPLTMLFRCKKYE